MISIQELNSQLIVVSPFHPALPIKARSIGGKWVDPSWVFDTRDRERVADLYRSVYGYDQFDVETVDIQVKLRDECFIYADKSALFLAGRQLARANGRDSNANLGDGVVMVAGDFRGGGSLKNWVTRSSEGAIFEIR